MKKVLFVFAFLLLFSSAFALSCASTQPRIGTVETISFDDDGIATVTLTDIKVFDPALVLRAPTGLDMPATFTDLQLIESVIVEYSTDEVNNLSNPTDNYLSEQRFSLEQWSMIDLEAGDILVVTSPYNVCDYAFFTIVKQGEIDHMLVNAYGGFVSDGTAVNVQPVDPPVECAPTGHALPENTCTVDVRLTITPNDATQQPTTQIIAINEGGGSIPATSLSIKLREARIEQEFLWGFDHYARYVLYFDSPPLPSITPIDPLIGSEPPTDPDSCVCIELYDPVCGNGKTYSNECKAGCDGVTDYVPGECEEIPMEEPPQPPKIDPPTDYGPPITKTDDTPVSSIEIVFRIFLSLFGIKYW